MSIFNMKLTQFINIPVFLGSFFLGIVCVFIMNNSERRKIIVYPTPDNEDEILYKDKSDTCFKFKHTQVNRPINQNELSIISAQ